MTTITVLFPDGPPHERPQADLPHGERCQATLNNHDNFDPRRGFIRRTCSRKAVTRYLDTDLCRQHAQSWMGELDR
jgi:hypothetical protein